MTVVLAIRAQLPSSPQQPEEASRVRRVRAVCDALFELCNDEEEASLEAGVGRLRQWERDLAALLRVYKDVAESATAKRESRATVARMSGARANTKAADVFAFGPPELYEALETCWRKALKLAVDAEAVTGYQSQSGRRAHSGLKAATQQLVAGRFSRVEIVELLADGPVSPTALERVRNRLKPECRTILE